MAKNRGKKYQDALKKVDSKKKYAVNDAVQLVKDIDFANFDSTVEVAFKLNVDTKQADQQLRGAVVLPNGTGKDQTVIVFAKGDNAKAAKDAGADFVGDTDLADKIQDGWLDFDVAIATPDMMPVVGRLGRILGLVQLLWMLPRRLKNLRLVRLLTGLTVMVMLLFHSVRLHSTLTS